MKQKTDNIKVGDVVVLKGYNGSAIGHNGIHCKVKFEHDYLGYFCESIDGTYAGWVEQEHLRKIA